MWQRNDGRIKRKGSFKIFFYCEKTSLFCNEQRMFFLETDNKALAYFHEVGYTIRHKRISKRAQKHGSFLPFAFSKDGKAVRKAMLLPGKKEKERKKLNERS